MIHRRTFLGAIGGGLATASCGWTADAPRRKRMAVITTVWFDRSHAWHMAERFLAGYPIEGRWHRPPLDGVSIPRSPKLSAAAEKSWRLTQCW